MAGVSYDLNVDDIVPSNQQPYPNGTAPPELDDAKHADIQFTLTEAVISAAGDIDENTVAKMRKGTAKEALELLSEGSYSRLAEAMAANLGGGEASIPTPYPVVFYAYRDGEYKVLGVRDGEKSQNGALRTRVVLAYVQSNGSVVCELCGAMEVAVNSSTTAALWFAPITYDESTGDTTGINITFENTAKKVINSAYCVTAKFALLSGSTITLGNSSGRKKTINPRYRIITEVGGEEITYIMTLSKGPLKRKNGDIISFTPNPDKSDSLMLEEVGVSSVTLISYDSSDVTINTGDLIGYFTPSLMPDSEPTGAISISAYVGYPVPESNSKSTSDDVPSV